jgi:hypothetical protein
MKNAVLPAAALSAILLAVFGVSFQRREEHPSLCRRFKPRLIPALTRKLL